MTTMLLYNNFYTFYYGGHKSHSWLFSECFTTHKNKTHIDTHTGTL